MSINLTAQDASTNKIPDIPTHKIILPPQVHQSPITYFHNQAIPNYFLRQKVQPIQDFYRKTFSRVVTFKAN